MELCGTQPVNLMGAHENGQYQTGGDDLGKHRGAGNACNSHMKYHYKQQVEKDIQYGSNTQKIQGPGGVTHCPQNPRSHVVDHHRDHTAEIDAQINGGVMHDVGWRGHETQHERNHENSDNSKSDAQKQRQQHGGMDGTFQFFLIFCTEIVGNHHTCAGGQSHEGSKQRIDNRCCGPHRGKCLVADKIAHDHTVNCVIQLLKKIANQKRYGKQNQMFPDGSGCHISRI